MESVGIHRSSNLHRRRLSLAARDNDVDGFWCHACRYALDPMPRCTLRHPTAGLQIQFMAQERHAVGDLTDATMGTSCDSRHPVLPYDFFVDRSEADQLAPRANSAAASRMRGPTLKPWCLSNCCSSRTSVGVNGRSAGGAAGLGGTAAGGGLAVAALLGGDDVDMLQARIRMSANSRKNRMRNQGTPVASPLAFELIAAGCGIGVTAACYGQLAVSW
jgi:hypothetical protein